MAWEGSDRGLGLGMEIHCIYFLIFWKNLVELGSTFIYVYERYHEYVKQRQLSHICAHQYLGSIS